MTRLVYWRILSRSAGTRHVALYHHSIAVQRVTPISIPRRYASTSTGGTPLTGKESRDLRAFIHELDAVCQSQELNEEHVVRALEVIRPMVRPLRKERKSAKSKTGKMSNTKSITSGCQHTSTSKKPSASSRQMTTQLHASATMPRLGCPIPLPLEKSHLNALRGFLAKPIRKEEGFKRMTSLQSSEVEYLPNTTRESLLRVQEVLYDILLVRSTLTYWLHFAKMNWKKGQKKELIEKITDLRKVARDRLALQGSGRVCKPVIDNGLERYTLFKYRTRCAERDGTSGATMVASIPLRLPLLSWESLFEGLSTAKQGYQRELYEAKTDIISYTLSRGAGNEVSA